MLSVGDTIIRELNVPCQKGFAKALIVLILTFVFVQATARMVAGWQAFGFCHGVLNTDNFTVLGLGLDFGPCRSVCKQINSRGRASGWFAYLACDASKVTDHDR